MKKKVYLKKLSEVQTRRTIKDLKRFQDYLIISEKDFTTISTTLGKKIKKANKLMTEILNFLDKKNYFQAFLKIQKTITLVNKILKEYERITKPKFFALDNLHTELGNLHSNLEKVAESILEIQKNIEQIAA